MKDYSQLANSIIENVGGKENVKEAFHCITRLRFTLKDKDLVKQDAFKGLKGVMGTNWSGDQLQVIIGNEVNEVYDAVCAAGGFAKLAEVPADDVKDEGPKTFAEKVSNFMKPLVDCIIPLMGVFIAGGLIKGLLSMFTVFGWMSAESGTYTTLYAIGDALFYFFPIFIGFNAGKVFKGNPFISALIGAGLVYPSIVSGATDGVARNFLGLPLNLISYTSTILPAFIAAWLAAKVEHFVDKYVPKVVRFMLVPTITLAVVFPITLLVVGPVSNLIANGIGGVISSLWRMAPAIGGAAIGGLWQVLVMTGLHTGMTPFIVELLMQNGYDILGICVTSSMVALAGAALALYTTSHNNDVKQISISAMISALLGVTEPAIYGVALPYKNAFLSVILGGAIGGCLGSILGVKVYGFGGMSLLQLPFTFGGDGTGNTVMWAIAVAVAFVSAFVIAKILCRDSFKEAE